MTGKEVKGRGGGLGRWRGGSAGALLWGDMRVGDEETEEEEEEGCEGGLRLISTYSPLSLQNMFAAPEKYWSLHSDDVRKIIISLESYGIGGCARNKYLHSCIVKVSFSCPKVD